MPRWRSLQQLREDFKASGIDLGKPSPKTGPGTHGCRGKVRHPTRAIAEAMRQRLLALTTETLRKRARLNVYRCRWCNFWHVGHRAPDRRPTTN